MTRLSVIIAVVGMLGVMEALARTAQAQAVQPEVRMDVIGPHPYAVHAGAGVGIALGTYARLGVVTAYGVRGSERSSEWRGDLIARMTLDPFRQRRWGLSVGGGITVRRQPYVLAIADLEGPAMAGWLPALQAGVGGGLRAGLVLRRAVAGRR